MEAVQSPVMSMGFYRITWLYFPEDLFVYKLILKPKMKGGHIFELEHNVE
jgi:hypothetical protein